MANTETAVGRGVFGIPTFFVGGEMFFGKDRLHAVEAELAKPDRPGARLPVVGSARIHRSSWG